MWDALKEKFGGVSLTKLRLLKINVILIKSVLIIL